MEKEREFFNAMLNGIAGLQDDFDANELSDEAKALLLELLEVCKSEYRMRFGDTKPE